MTEHYRKGTVFSYRLRSTAKLDSRGKHYKYHISTLTEQISKVITKLQRHDHTREIHNYIDVNMTKRRSSRWNSVSLLWL